MNCLNTVGSGINNKQLSDLIIITGDGTYTTEIVSNKYIITFTGGNNQVSFNKDISSFNVFAIGGGGGGGNSSSSNAGAGGAGGGFGLWSFSYIKNSVHDVSVKSGGAPATTGGNASFLFNGNGITAAGGPGGDVSRTSESTCSMNGNPGGTFTAKNGGYGGRRNGENGGNSSGPITVLGFQYNYGGGGRGPSNTNINVNSGGNAGSKGVGGVGQVSSGSGGQNGTSFGAGAGGAGSKNGGASGGTGGKSAVIIIFTYP